MIRAIFCLNGPNAVNGPNVWISRHLPLLAEKGIEPMALYLSWDLDTPCDYRRLLEKAGVTVVPLRLGRFIEDNAVAIAQIVSSLAPDVFVPNYSVAGYYAARFLREIGIITIGTLHSDDPYYHDIIDVFVASHNHWQLSGVTCVSEYLCSLVKERVNGTLPILHAPYGAPVPLTKARWSPDFFRVVYSGRLVESQKRIHRVINALGEAVQKSPKIEGILYGDGPERSHVEQSITNWNGRIRLGGLLDPIEMQKVLLEGQAFVLLSDFEGLSIALMEAMACGLVPIVTPMRSGVTDLIENGVTGIIVPPDDSHAFAEAVAELSSNTVLWKKISNAARQAIIERDFTIEKCADVWASFLNTLPACQKKYKSLSIPSYHKWDMPPRSSRSNGIRLEDRRTAWPKIKEAKEANRPLFLWGASNAGIAFYKMIEKNSFSVQGFIDSDYSKQGKLLHGVRIHTPEQLITFIHNTKRPFVIITSQFEDEISELLKKMGMQEEFDFVAG